MQGMTGSASHVCRSNNDIQISETRINQKDDNCKEK